MQKLGVFWKIQDICYIMGTEIFKIEEEMTEKMKPKVANPLSKNGQSARTAGLKECRVGRVQGWKSAGLKVCRVKSVQGYKSAGLEERVQDWKSARLE